MKVIGTIGPESQYLNYQDQFHKLAISIYALQEDAIQHCPALIVLKDERA